MQIEYKKDSLKSICTDFNKATKKYNILVAEKLIATINYIENAATLIDVRNYAPFNFHDLKGNKEGLYAIDLGRKLGYRLIVKPFLINCSPAQITDIFSSNAINIKIIKIEEVSNHYE